MDRNDRQRCRAITARTQSKRKAAIHDLCQQSVKKLEVWKSRWEKVVRKERRGCVYLSFPSCSACEMKTKRSFSSSGVARRASEF